MIYRSASVKQLLIASGLTVALLNGCATIDGFFNKKPKVVTPSTEVSTPSSDTSTVPSDSTSNSTPSTNDSTAVDTTTESPSTTNTTDSSTSSSSESGTFHTIVKGDSLYKISKKYGCSIADLVKWNNFKNAQKVILPGQKIRVSAP